MKYTLILIFTIVCFLQNNAQENDSIKKADSGNTVFEEVQIPAQFPDGLKGWAKYLEKNLNASLGSDYIVIPKRKKSALATVLLSFIIDTEGNVSEVKADSTIPDNIHPALIKEAIRVITNGPKWSPAILNGQKVKYRHRQSITWQAFKE